ncbi:MAG: flagellar export chaperone FlgN [Phycisphaerales bacterium]|nr:flagellar export chaperone FlgN [Phycisphaerales bacterium]
MTGQPTAAELLTLLDAQHELYVTLDDLSRRQRSLIDAQSTDELIRVLGQRERVIDGLNAIQGRLEPVVARWADVLAAYDPTEQDRISGRVEAMQTLAMGIAARDEADRAVMESRRQSIGQELKGLGRHREALAAYGPRGSSRPRYQDREG